MSFGTEFSIPICFSLKLSSESHDVRRSGTPDVPLLMAQLISTVGDNVNVAHSVAVGRWWMS